MLLDRHEGRRARYREGMSWWLGEFGRPGLTFLHLSPFASVSPVVSLCLKGCICCG